MNPKGKAFRFKQFSVYQSQSAMKVGTDAVILGAYTKVEAAKSILDIGCGTAVLSLMLAQKSSAQITAIEIESAAAKEAAYNVSISPWKDQIKVLHQDFLSFYNNQSANSYDLIICNPPFFRGKNSNDSRSLARQSSNLPFEQLFEGVTKLLSADGSFYGIFPNSEMEYLSKIFKANQLFVNKRLLLKGNAHSAVKRVIVCLKKKATDFEEEILIIEEKRNEYTKDCHEILRPYLLYL